MDVQCADLRLGDPAPYPALAVVGRSIGDAALLRADYAGAGGALMMAIRYQVQAVAADCGEIAALLRGLAVCEFEHMARLVEAIVALGGEPVVSDAVVDVGRSGTVTEQLHLDLAGEYAAIDRYERHAAQATDPSVRALLKRIALDERCHTRLLRQAIALIDA